MGEKVCLMGNVSPSEGMLDGNPSTIKGMIRDCIMKAADNPAGFVLATGVRYPSTRHTGTWLPF